MEIKIDVPVFSPEKGFEYKWEDGFMVTAKVVNGSIYITANKEGLVSLANHLLNLSQKNIPLGHHLHFDEHNSLEEGSCDLIIEKKHP